MAKVYAVTMPEDHPLDARSLKGLGTWERGQCRDCEDLTDGQIESLRGKGLEVKAKTAKKSKPKTEELPAVTELPTASTEE